jgi:hypothetical protein
VKAEEYSGIFLVILGLIAILAYVSESVITKNASVYWWLVPVGIVFFGLGVYLYRH